MMSKENDTQTGSGGGQDDCLTRDFLEKRRDRSCGAEMRSTIGIVTWDTPMSYFFPVLISNSTRSLCES